MVPILSAPTLPHSHAPTLSRSHAVYPRGPGAKARPPVPREFHCEALAGVADPVTTWPSKVRMLLPRRAGSAGFPQGRHTAEPDCFRPAQASRFHSDESGRADIFLRWVCQAQERIIVGILEAALAWRCGVVCVRRGRGGVRSLHSNLHRNATHLAA
jgi:hypothetical protein